MKVNAWKCALQPPVILKVLQERVLGLERLVNAA